MTQPSCQVEAEVLAEVAEVQNKATKAVVVALGMPAVPLKLVEKIWAESLLTLVSCQAVSPTAWEPG